MTAEINDEVRRLQDLEQVDKELKRLGGFLDAGYYPFIIPENFPHLDPDYVVRQREGNLVRNIGRVEDAIQQQRRMHGLPGQRFEDTPEIALLKDRLETLNSDLARYRGGDQEDDQQSVDVE